MLELFHNQSNKYKSKISKKDLAISKLEYELDLLRKHISMQDVDQEETIEQAEDMEMDFNYEDDLTLKIKELE